MFDKRLFKWSEGKNLCPKAAVNINTSLVFPYLSALKLLMSKDRAINVKLRVIGIINEQKKKKILILARFFLLPTKHD